MKYEFIHKNCILILHRLKLQLATPRIWVFEILKTHYYRIYVAQQHVPFSALRVVNTKPAVAKSTHLQFRATTSATSTTKAPTNDRLTNSTNVKQWWRTIQHKCREATKSSSISIAGIQYELSRQTKWIVRNDVTLCTCEDRNYEFVTTSSSHRTAAQYEARVQPCEIVEDADFKLKCVQCLWREGSALWVLCACAIDDKRKRGNLRILKHKRSETQI